MNWEEYSCSLSCLGCEEQKCAIDHANRSELGVLLHNMKNNVFDIKPYPSAARNSDFTTIEKCTGNTILPPFISNNYSFPTNIDHSTHFQQTTTTPRQNQNNRYPIESWTAISAPTPPSQRSESPAYGNTCENESGTAIERSANRSAHSTGEETGKTASSSRPDPSAWRSPVSILNQSTPLLRGDTNTPSQSTAEAIAVPESTTSR